MTEARPSETSSHLREVRELFGRRVGGYAKEAPAIWQENLIDPLLGEIRAGDRVLDLCCGPGPVGLRILNLMSAAHVNVVFADLIWAFLRDIEGSRACVDAHRLPFADNSFDVVVMRQGLHYCRPENSINEMSRVSSRIVAVGNVVMDQPSDLAFWREYSAIVTPSRCVFLTRGRIAGFLSAAGALSVSTMDDWGGGALQGSIRHLDTAGRVKARDVFLSQPDDIVRRYRITPAPIGEVTYRVPWEFSVGHLASA